jgi:hypothetical protein
LANTTPSVCIAPNAAIQTANAQSAVHLTLHRLETVVEQMATRLSRLERNHSSLRRRLIAEKGRVMTAGVVQFMSAGERALEAS